MPGTNSGSLSNANFSVVTQANDNTNHQGYILLNQRQASALNGAYVMFSGTVPAGVVVGRVYKINCGDQQTMWLTDMTGAAVDITSAGGTFSLTIWSVLPGTLGTYSLTASNVVSGGITLPSQSSQPCAIPDAYIVFSARRPAA